MLQPAVTVVEDREKLFCEVKLQDRKRTTEWTLRQLSGKWLIESTTSRTHGAKCGTVDEVMNYAMDYHDESWDPPE